jgi:hypothetical protein
MNRRNGMCNICPRLYLTLDDDWEEWDEVKTGRNVMCNAFPKVLQ